MIEQIRAWLSDWVRRQYAEILTTPTVDHTAVRSVSIEADKRRLAMLKAEWQALTGQPLDEPWRPDRG